MQKHVNLVDLVKSFPKNIYLQNLASIQKRTSSVKIAHLAEKSGKGSISNLSTKTDTDVGPERSAGGKEHGPLVLSRGQDHDDEKCLVENLGGGDDQERLSHLKQE